MSTTPTQPIDPEANEPTHDENVRIIALQYASFLSTKETSLTEFLKKCGNIEKYITTGRTRVIEDPSVPTTP